MTAHAELGASSSARWMRCPGSVPLSRPYEGRTSSYAAEGIVAHSIAEAALSGASRPAVGAVLKADGHDVAVTQEMEDAIDAYLDVVTPLRKQSDWHAFEKRVVIRSALPAECFGTADFAALVGKTLHIVDFKFGKGVIVEVENNSQALFYALAAHETFEEIADSVQEIPLVIVQPRIDNARIKEWTIDLIDLFMWRDSRLLPAVARAVEGDDSLQDGPWCRFCPVLAYCPLKYRAAQEAARAAFGSNSVDISVIELAPRLRLAMRPTDWIATPQDEATLLIRRGEDVPGFKLVEGRSKRTWATDEGTVWKETIKRSGIDSFQAEQLFEPPTLKSPFQVEKVLKRWERDPIQILDGLVNRPPGKPTLIADADPRPAMEYPSAIEAFRGSVAEEI
jgi:hypothetical protein